MGIYLLLLCLQFSIYVHLSNGCTINEVTQWFEPQHFWMQDTHRGVIITQTTANIEGIQVTFGDGLNRGPYISVTHINSVLTVSTTDAFAEYEEYETLLSIRFTILFSCVGGTTRPLTYVFNINDTNNHAPVFMPSDSFEFSLALPVPPGFKVSGCDYLIVRDIDLTTYRIDFDIQDNPNFEIVYYGQIQPKVFGAYITTKTLIRSLPDSLSLEIHATDVDATKDDPLRSTAVVNIIADNAFRLPDPLFFSAAFYEADYTDDNDLILRNGYISLQEGYDDQVRFGVQGEYSQYFDLVDNNNRLSFVVKSPLPEDISESQILLVVVAEREFTNSASATVVVHLPKEAELRFELPLYKGQIEDNILTVPKLTLVQGYEETLSISIINEYASYFSSSREGNIITLSMQPLPASVIQNNNVLSIQVVAYTNRNVSSSAVVVLEIIKDDYITPIFGKSMYNGTYDAENGLILEPIILVQGFDDTVLISLTGDHASYFDKVEQNSEIRLTASIPPEIWSDGNILISVVATKPRTVGANTAVLISLPSGESTVSNITFDKILYNGVIRLGNVVHETITITGYTGKNIEILGQHAELFEASLSAGVVVINLRPSAILPNVSHIALELQVAGAGAVLVLHILEPDTPVPPTVTFGSASYVLRADVTHTGSIGQVQATSDNGEAIRYSLVIDEAHLRERLSISNDGELRLTAPANTGMYSFQVVATTAITQASATVPVHLSIEVVTVCGDDIVVPPLIILERDEEEPHRNLVVLNSTFGGCEFTLTNIWPEGQSWLYVDADGLHSTAIDREHESIAFMAVSQIQVELILGCEGDVSSRTKRSLRSKSTDRLGPYEYGSNKWILTDSIRYNARRSLVNLIVNDINDNVPKFVGKENEPIVSIVVGYPVPSLEAIILPTALVELKATDADIGENAALVYWSTDESLAVSPTTGFVHVRTSSNLQNNARFTVHATDQNGAGHTGSLEVTVKLLEINRIGVFSIRNAFLEDEQQILGNLSKTAGYDVKALRSVVISESIISRDMMRASSNELTPTLQLFVYGLIEQEPVEITQLIADINNAPVTVNVANVLSLEDHLKGTEICVLPGRDNGLLAATIALSVLIFILILAFAVWYFLKWRKNINYDQFSDRNSMASRNVSIEELKSEINAKPRLNIEELKKSERKLKERLDTPVTDDSAKPSVSREQPMESIINISTPDPQMPIIIQTIDKLKYNAEESEDDDEFGEKMKSRRKSVVTFNENVEKIIHVEENPHNNDDNDYEVFKL